MAIISALRSRWRPIFEVQKTVLMLGAAGAMLWQHRGGVTRAPEKKVAVPPQPIDVQAAPTRGMPTARVAIVEYSDFQCPFCGRVARDTLTEIDRAYVDTGRVRLVFKNLPLSMHKFAQGAAEAAMCASAQHEFWPMHDLIFAHQDKLSAADLNVVAQTVGVDVEAFSRCLSTGQARAQISADASEGERLGIESTPTFLVGRYQTDGRVRVVEVIQGATSAAHFKDVLDPLLAQR